MDSGSAGLTACQLQLLALNALFEQARSKTKADDCLRAIQDSSALAVRIEESPETVAVHELEDAHARVLYHALMA